jgi:hypothetical protein
MNTKEEELIYLAERIKSAALKAYQDCENEKEDYNIFNELERRAIELEEIDNREHKLKLLKLSRMIPRILCLFR